jgi:hypothetical protein
MFDHHQIRPQTEQTVTVEVMTREVLAGLDAAAVRRDAGVCSMSSLSAVKPVGRHCGSATGGSATGGSAQAFGAFSKLTPRRKGNSTEVTPDQATRDA